MAEAGGFRNGKTRHAAADELLACLLPSGYTMRLVSTPGHGYLHTLCVVYYANGSMRHILPRDTAEAISNTLHRMPHPALQAWEEQPMKRIAVDYNAVMQDIEHDNRVILGQVGHPTGERLPPLTVGDHMVTYEEEMEVEGIVEREGTFWLATLDWNTIKRFTSTME